MAIAEEGMAVISVATQLAARRRGKHGAFGGGPAGMHAPTPQEGGPVPPAQQPMPLPQEGAPIPMDQAGMMQYLQEKANQIRQRMGADAMNNGALDAVLSAMPTQGKPPGGV